jgi:hypothetical protein
MTKTYTDRYWKDHKEQSDIELAILEALKPGWYYYNIVLVLLKLASQYTDCQLWHIDRKTDTEIYKP